MTKKTRIWLFAIASILMLPILTLTVWYQVYTQNLTDQPPAIDLFIAEIFFDEDGSTPFTIVPQDQRRPVNWQLDPRQFETLDTVVIALKNTSGEKFYYTSWGAPFTRLRKDLVIYKDGLADTIPFDGHGCSTGIYAAPLSDNETMKRAMCNPLMFDPYSNWDLPLQSDSFPAHFREIYGDSVAIMFSQATYSSPWNHYKSQLISSDYMVVSVDKVLDNWKQGKYARLPKAEPTMEEHFGLKPKPNP